MSAKSPGRGSATTLPAAAGPAAPFDAVAGETAPAWLATLPDRPTICVTLGTSLNEPLLFGVLLEALAGLDTNIIATMRPGNDPRLLPVQPEQVHVERYIPQ